MCGSPEYYSWNWALHLSITLLERLQTQMLYQDPAQSSDVVQDDDKDTAGHVNKPAVNIEFHKEFDVAEGKGSWWIHATNEMLQKKFCTGNSANDVLQMKCCK